MNIVVLSILLFILHLAPETEKYFLLTYFHLILQLPSQQAQSYPIKMRPVYTLVPAVAAIGAAASQPSDSWVFGTSLFYLGPPSGNARITKATYSILPPSVPTGTTVSNKNDEVWVSVWVGASSTAGDDNANLYQPLFNWSPDQESQYVEF